MTRALMSMRRGALSERPASSGSIPSTAVLDDFNRADESPLSDGGQWGVLGGGGAAALQVASNAATGTAPAQASEGYWNPSAFGPDCEVYVTVSTLPSSTANYIRLRIRISNAGSFAAQTSYMMQWSRDTNGCRIFKETSTAAFTQLAQAAAATFTTGDQLCLRAVGTSISVYKNGVLVLTVTDSTFAAAGNIGVGCRDTTTRLDNFGGGSV